MTVAASSSTVLRSVKTPGQTQGTMVGGGRIFVPLLLIPALIMTWQIVTLDPADADNAKARFKANGWVGFALTLAFFAEFTF